MNNRQSRTKLVLNTFQKARPTQSRWRNQKLMLPLVLLLAIGFDFSEHGVSAHGHSHDGHGHSHEHETEEPAAFKWSREANIQEDEILEDEIVDLPPKRGPPPPKVKQAHSHMHESHGHSHGGHGHSHGPPQREPTPEERQKHRERLHKLWDDDDEDLDVGRNVWMQAISATLLISAAPFFILFFIPLDNSEEKRWALKITLSFASGGLLGDAFLHLIPHAMMAIQPLGEDGHGHSHSHGHSHGGGGHSHGDGEGGHAHDMSVGLGVLAGILAFLMVEKLVRIYNGGSGGHGHSHTGTKTNKTSEEGKENDSETTEGSSDAEDKKTKDKSKGSDDEAENSENNDEKAEKSSESDTKVVSEDEEKKIVPNIIDSTSAAEQKSEIKVAGFLNLVADGFHNFTDGLAIGASFAAGQGVGMITTFTILFHEIPHEIGDYAILIQSGVSPMKAIMLQSMTAIGALLGCIVALLAQGGDFGSSGIILPFTAGGFIYIATVSVIPELLEGASSFKQSIMEILALISGVIMMVIIAQYE